MPEAGTVRARIRWSRHAAVGAAFGVLLAVCLHAWQLYATSRSGMAPEGVAFITFGMAHLLGFPTNLLLSAALDLPARSEYGLLLLGIVANWTLVALARGRLQRQRG
jgi:hypothetical protein